MTVCANEPLALFKFWVHVESQTPTRRAGISLLTEVSEGETLFME